MGFCALRRLPGRASFQPCKRYSQFRIDFLRWSFWPALVSSFVASQTAVASGWLPACRTLASSRACTLMTQSMLIQRLSFWLVSMIFFSWFSTLHIVRSLTSIPPCFHESFKKKKVPRWLLRQTRPCEHASLSSLPCPLHATLPGRAAPAVSKSGNLMKPGT